MCYPFEFLWVILRSPGLPLWTSIRWRGPSPKTHSQVRFPKSTELGITLRVIWGRGIPKRCPFLVDEMPALRGLKELINSNGNSSTKLASNYYLKSRPSRFIFPLSTVGWYQSKVARRFRLVLWAPGRFQYYQARHRRGINRQNLCRYYWVYAALVRSKLI